MHQADNMGHFSDIIAAARKGAWLRLERVGRVHCEPGWQLGPDWAKRLTDFDLWFIWRGRGELTSSAGQVALHPGMCLWMRPGRRYEVEQDPENRLGVSFLHFSFVDVAPRRSVPPFEVMETRQLEFVDALLRRVIELKTAGASDSADVLFGALLQELVREQASSPPETVSGVTRYHVETVHRVARAIRESPGEAWTVAALAKAAGYNVDHFSRVFRQVIGKGPQRFLIDARMERARQLLAESEFTVGQIAEVLGFENRHFFSRQFLQHNACTPSAFRERGAMEKT